MNYYCALLDIFFLTYSTDLLNYVLYKVTYWLYNVQYKVLSIWSYNIIPYFWQFVNSIAKKLHLDAAWRSRMSQANFWYAVLMWTIFQYGRTEVREGKAWVIRRVRLNFLAAVFQTLFSRYCNMRPSVAMLENYCEITN